LVSVVALGAAADGAQQGVAYIRTPSAAEQSHVELVKAFDSLRPSLPRAMNENATLVGLRVEGATGVYLIQFAPHLDGIDLKEAEKAEEVSARSAVCSQPEMTTEMSNGATYRYVYSSTHSEKFLFAVDIKSCP
jgi:hypothetical protein